MHKLRVGVLMGGKSIEREVSFNSGRTVCDHLDTMRYEIIPLFQTVNGDVYILPWHFLHRGKIDDFKNRLTGEAKHIEWDDVKKIIDFMYIATHGRYAEDGTLQAILELFSIPYLGSGLFSSALCMDKNIQKKILIQNDIIVPRGITIPVHEVKQGIDIFLFVDILQKKNIFFPYIVKPSCEGSSLGISIVFNEQELYDALFIASNIDTNKKQSVIVEEKIDGMEFSCIIITDYKTGQLLPLPPTEIIHEKNSHLFDYKQKYMPGRATKFTPPRCSDELVKKIQQTCINVINILEIKNIARIDGFINKNNDIVIIDPNTLSGMGPASFVFREAAEIGMGHTQLINHLIETELHGYGMLSDIIKAEKKAKKVMKINKLRVAVLFGGRSNEKEVSLETGRNITFKLSPQKYESVPVFVSSEMELYILTQSQLVRNSTKEIELLVAEDQKISWNSLSKRFDFVFIGLHGAEGENGTVQGTLEMLNIPYNGSSVLTSALCMDKYKTAHFLHKQGFAVPRNILIEKYSWEKNNTAQIQKIKNAFVFPCIVKPHDDGCSVMVEKITNEQDCIDQINRLFSNKKEAALVEEFVVGMELTIGVIGNNTPQALVPSQVVLHNDILSIEEKFLPGAGENQTPANLQQEAIVLIQKTVEQVYTTLGCKGYVRIDCFYQTAQQSLTGKEQVVILEVNTLPGMTPATCIFHQAAECGYKPMDFIDKIIQLGLEEHSHKVLIEKEIIGLIKVHKDNSFLM